MLVLFSAVAIGAQTPARIAGFVSSFENRFAGPSLNGRTEFTAPEVEAATGYGFSRRFSLCLPVTPGCGFLDRNGPKTYRQ